MTLRPRSSNNPARVRWIPSYPPGGRVAIALSCNEQYDRSGRHGPNKFCGINGIISGQRPILKRGSRIIDAERLTQSLKEGNIAVVAGFQGIDGFSDVTTLGRGGSDLTALQLATALKANFCDIYTDVDGVYTTDPNMVPQARKLDKISYDEMLEMASSGAKVLPEPFG